MDIVQDSRNDLRATGRSMPRRLSTALGTVDRVHVYNADTNVQIIPRTDPGQVIPRKNPIVMSPRKDPGQVPFVVNYHY
jgi:hypothetical protein